MRSLALRILEGVGEDGHDQWEPHKIALHVRRPCTEEEMALLTSMHKDLPIFEDSRKVDNGDRR